MNARKLTTPPQASADPLGHLYAVRAEEAEHPRVQSHGRRLRQKPGIPRGLRKGLVWSALGASVVALAWAATVVLG